MKLVTRRSILRVGGYLLMGSAGFAAVPDTSILCKLSRSRDGSKPTLETNDHRLIGLSGDDDTMGVLNDKRLLNSDFEAVGHFNSPAQFAIDGIYTRSMFVHKDGKRLMITYWCDVCYIRTYTPGTCVCCQKYTDLDLREHDD